MDFIDDFLSFCPPVHRFWHHIWKGSTACTGKLLETHLIELYTHHLGLLDHIPLQIRRKMSTPNVGLTLEDSHGLGDNLGDFGADQIWERPQWELSLMRTIRMNNGTLVWSENRIAEIRSPFRGGGILADLVRLGHIRAGGTLSVSGFGPFISFASWSSCSSEVIWREYWKRHLLTNSTTSRKARLTSLDKTFNAMSCLDTLCIRQFLLPRAHSSNHSPGEKTKHKWTGASVQFTWSWLGLAVRLTWGWDCVRRTRRKWPSDSRARTPSKERLV